MYTGAGIINPQATYIEDQFEGDGSTAVFTLSETVASDAAADVYMQGALQDADQYTISGRTLTFTSAPADGVLVRVRYGRRETVMYVPDASVGRDQLTQDVKDYSESVLSGVVTASGTAVSFTGIPSWVRHITLITHGLSTNGTTKIQVRVGDSGGYHATGYTGVQSDDAGSSATLSTGFDFHSVAAAAGVYHLICDLYLVDEADFTWICNMHGSRSDAAVTFETQGFVNLDTALTQIQLYAGGTDTFDAGSVNLRYGR